MDQATQAVGDARPAPARTLDALVIGAGVAGLYQFHPLRELGLDMRAVEAGSGGAAGANLISQTTSWYLGSDVPGKPRRVLSHTGGVGACRQKCTEVAASGYQGFATQ